MTAQEYFGDWMRVVDEVELIKVMRWLGTIDKNLLCPSISNIFKAFKICPLRECKVVLLSQDPYPQKGVATGLTFGNSKDTPEEQLSPSLQIIKEAMINYEIPHNQIEFDNSLESLAEQGVLMLNSALTCEVNRVGSHYNIWKPFMSKLIHNLSIYNPGLIYILFGNQACSFKYNIANSADIIEVYHPAYFARKGIKMSPEVFIKLKDTVKYHFGVDLKYYKETEYGTC